MVFAPLYSLSRCDFGNSCLIWFKILGFIRKNKQAMYNLPYKSWRCISRCWILLILVVHHLYHEHIFTKVIGWKHIIWLNIEFWWSVRLLCYSYSCAMFCRSWIPSKIFFTNLYSLVTNRTKVMQHNYELSHTNYLYMSFQPCVILHIA